MSTALALKYKDVMMPNTTPCLPFSDLNQSIIPRVN
jgi:hypothetical protein